MKRLDSIDLQHVLNKTEKLWPEFKDKTVFISGGTGFFGKWLLESFMYANNTLLLNITVYVLSRDPEIFLSDLPHFKQDYIKFIKGDISTFEFPSDSVDYIIHAATEASASLNLEQPLLMYDTIVNGTKHMLEFAKIKNVKAILHTSSGAVYGEQPVSVKYIAENADSSPDILAKNSAYGEGKRVAEMLSALYYHQYNVKSKIARCFAFVGPYLPLKAHFAVGNFIFDVINNKQIQIKGDGSQYRSYLYAADLVVWLLKILVGGEICRPYNVGSDEDVTISELAGKIAGFNNGSVSISEKYDNKLPPKRYVPSVERAKNELGLEVSIGLEEALKKTFSFYNAKT
jgi:nucleoside-diphosphate-sugar epimerase